MPILPLPFLAPGNAALPTGVDSGTGRPAIQALPLPCPQRYGQARLCSGPWDRPSPELTADACRHILELADTCSSLSEQMHLMSDAAATSPSGRAGLVGKPAFQQLVRDFAAALTLLTAAVDELQENGEDWEQFIADSRLLKVLKAGVAGWERHKRR
ncbi:hypothetical protein [Rhizobium sp. RAF56]|uniref:hypothetical protein n=1 Tax=Rhizobium sp. RAF56 TaxID=3233062 RepID=UPI003F983692